MTNKYPFLLICFYDLLLYLRPHSLEKKKQKKEQRMLDHYLREDKKEAKGAERREIPTALARKKDC